MAIAYQGLDLPLSYWRLASGIEVGFVVGDVQVAIEAKSARRVTADHLKGLQNLRLDQARVGRRILIGETSQEASPGSGDGEGTYRGTSWRHVVGAAAGVGPILILTSDEIRLEQERRYRHS